MRTQNDGLHFAPIQQSRGIINNTNNNNNNNNNNNIEIGQQRQYQ